MSSRSSEDFLASTPGASSYTPPPGSTVRAYLEVWGKSGAELYPLEGQRTTLGRADANVITIGDDNTVSQLHAVVESYGSWFVIRDVGSSNGTFVNGERVAGEHRLRPGDELRLGETRLVFRSQGTSGGNTTAAAEGPPELTKRERELLIALCRPLLGGDAFNQPASIKQLAGELYVSDAAVKFHLSNLYDKFGIYDTAESRRVQLANEAIRRRAVTVGDLRARPS